MTECDCVQVSVAFSIVYNSGLNEYALYLDCEGDRKYHRGYEMTMSHVFKKYRWNARAYKVSVARLRANAPDSDFPNWYHRRRDLSFQIKRPPPCLWAKSRPVSTARLRPPG